MSDEPYKANRNDIRSGIFSNSKAKSKQITFFGQQIEIRQPSMRVLLNLQMEEEDPARRASTMIVGYAFVPGTNEKIFEEADIDTIMEMPFGDDMKRLNDTINELTGLTQNAVNEKEKNSESTQTDSTS